MGTETLCRTCLSAANSTKKSIYDQYGDNVKYIEMLESCLGMELVNDDTRPKDLCSPCSKLLPQAWRFLEMCRASERALKNEFDIHNDGNVFFDVASVIYDDEIKDEVNDEILASPSGYDFVNDDEEYPPNKSSESPDNINCKLDLKKELPEDVKSEADSDNDVLIKLVSKKKKRDKNKFKKVRQKQRECPSCDTVVESECRYKKHIKQFHPELLYLLINYPCETCGKVFKRKSDYKVHSRVHSGEKPFACQFCPMRFAQSGTLSEHQRNHTGATPYVCTVCKRVFSSRSSYWRHGRVHTKERPYSCEECGKSFSHNSTLKAHRYVHSEERPHTCNVCTKTTKTKYAMQQHMLIHSGKHYVCEECGKAFALRSNLLNHKKKMHSNIAGKCGVCGKETSNLSEHANIHADEPQYSCGVCGRGFRLKSSMSLHLALHRNASKYKCDFGDCTSAFPKAHMLDFHFKKEHSKETSHTCKHCNKGFFRTSDLTRHLNTIHILKSF